MRKRDVPQPLILALDHRPRRWRQWEARGHRWPPSIQRTAGPGGLHVTTAAYEAFVLEDDLQGRVLAVLPNVSLERPAGVASAPEVVARLFAEQPVPVEMSDAVSTAYRNLGADPQPVAVRSSATAEDLPKLSFASRQDSYLNVRGESEVLAAIKRCWASLWTEQALDYRLRHEVLS